MEKLGRNDPCRCGSGRKYKKCCLMSDEVQARRAALAALPVEAGDTSPGTGVLAPPIPAAPAPDPEAEARRERFEAAGLEERTRILREALAEGKLDGDDAYEMLAEIRDALTHPTERGRTDLAALEAFDAMVEGLRARLPSVFAEQWGIYERWLMEDAALDRPELLPGHLAPFAADPDRFQGELTPIFNLLLYHGHLAPLLETLRSAWPALSRLTRFGASIADETFNRLVALTVLNYLESAEQPSADDPALHTAWLTIPGVGPADAAGFEDLAHALLGEAEPLRAEDFARGIGELALSRNLLVLSMEWLGELHRRYDVPLGRGELARGRLFHYLISRAQVGAHGVELLVPRRDLLQHHLQVPQEWESTAVYGVFALLEVLPLYARFLGERGLCSQELAEQRARDLVRLPAALRETMSDYVSDARVLEELDRVVATTGATEEGTPAPPLPAVSRDLELALLKLVEAGEHASDDVLEGVRAHGAAAIPRLIAMALDQRLNNADSDTPDVWAPMHAVRLLGELRAADAVEPLLPLFDWEDDWLEEALPEVYGRIGAPALPALRALLLSVEKDTYARSRGATGLKHLASRYPEHRDEVVGLLVDCLSDEAGNGDDPTLNGFIIRELLDLRAEEALPAIRQAFDDGRVDEFIIGWEHVEDELGMSPEPRRLPEPQQRRAKPMAVPAQANPGRGPSRNQPCPCGSGRKYKKCCGQTA